MINTVYKLISPKHFEKVFQELEIKDNVIVRPTHLSICNADQRYYQGSRSPEILNEKLPMALIHEAIGEVIYDDTGTYKPKDKVILIPILPKEKDNIVDENYLESSLFKSSDCDGFMCDYISIKPDRLIKIPENSNLNLYSFTELITVAYQTIKRFEQYSNPNKNTIGVWGDGNLGYILSLLLKVLYPNSEIIIFGVNVDKLEMFSFADKTYLINEIPENLRIDHGFEAVGGLNSQDAINQIINIIKPKGTIALLGVSEHPIQLNTRKILEKGLVLYGTTRSSREDFKETLDLIQENPEVIDYLENIINKTMEFPAEIQKRRTKISQSVK